MPEWDKLKKIKALKGTILGTYEFMAPEVKNKNYDEKIDIFSMGCVFYEMIFLKPYQKQIYSRENKDIKSPKKEKNKNEEINMNNMNINKFKERLVDEECFEPDIDDKDEKEEKEEKEEKKKKNGIYSLNDMMSKQEFYENNIKSRLSELKEKEKILLE